jgi:glycosidase
MAGASIFGAGLNACTQVIVLAPTATSSPQVAPEAEPTAEKPAAASKPTASPTPAGRIRLFEGNMDAWAWETQVRGAVENLDCEEIQVTVNEQAVDAKINGSLFQAAIPVAPGDNRLLAACRPGVAEWERVMVNGRLRNAPEAVIAIRTEGGTVLVDGSGSKPAPVDPAPVRQYRWSGVGLIEGQPETQALEITPPTEDGEYFLALEVTDEQGRSDTARSYFVVADGQPRLDDWTWQNTAWVEDAVVYGVIPRKFGQEGFKSIARRFDAMEELGVNAIWLAPINSTPPGDYGYAVTDYFELREGIGTKDEFRAFVKDAHSHGIRVLMDFVPNHSSNQHPYYLDALEKGEESHYWTYYDRDEDGKPTHYFNWERLPNLNYSNPEVENWILEGFSYWVREFDVDGFRVDACWGVKQRKPDFWPRWRAALKRIKPDLLLLAEASARDDYYFTDGFDAAYDWTDQLGKWAWERVFDDPKLLLYNLNAALTNNRTGYHEDALIFRFLNNNDTGERFLTVNGQAMTKVATTLLLTLPGIPCIYTGDEIGAEYTPYGDPLPLNWEKEARGMFEFHKKLIHLRHEVPALHSRGWQIVEAEPHQQVLAYLRYSGEGSAPVLVLLNFGDAPAQAVVSLPAAFAAKLAGRQLSDLLTDETIAFNGSGPVDMPPLSARVLRA